MAERGKVEGVRFSGDVMAEAGEVAVGRLFLR
jgi:hypothetical protein